ncbi:hypothetical protein Purlil1_13853 [Purpureocillium lilacinum]|uniref:Uncharacterized protein n=1 Tax=Purpureocillium lilacinum TaxID=33203 RepID=A0ABR0BD86_PURLI|nr:hypothetical protein Purlil1_13853 [Purpureocillium lilacinum]
MSQANVKKDELQRQARQLQRYHLSKNLGEKQKAEVTPEDLELARRIDPDYKRKTAQSEVEYLARFSKPADFKTFLERFRKNGKEHLGPEASAAAASATADRPSAASGPSATPPAKSRGLFGKVTDYLAGVEQKDEEAKASRAESAATSGSSLEPESKGKGKAPLTGAASAASTPTTEARSASAPTSTPAKTGGNSPPSATAVGKNAGSDKNPSDGGSDSETPKREPSGEPGSAGNPIPVPSQSPEPRGGPHNPISLPPTASPEPRGPRGAGRSGRPEIKDEDQSDHEREDGADDSGRRSDSDGPDGGDPGGLGGAGPGGAGSGAGSPAGSDAGAGGTSGAGEGGTSGAGEGGTSGLGVGGGNPAEDSGDGGDPAVGDGSNNSPAASQDQVSPPTSPSPRSPQREATGSAGANADTGPPSSPGVQPADDGEEFQPLVWEMLHQTDSHGFMPRPPFFYRGSGPGKHGIEEDRIHGFDRFPHYWYRLPDSERSNQLVWCHFRGKVKRGGLAFELPGQTRGRIEIFSPSSLRVVDETFRRETGRAAPEVPYGDALHLRRRTEAPNEIAYADSKGKKRGDTFLIWHKREPKAQVLTEEWFPLNEVRPQLGAAVVNTFLERPEWNLPALESTTRLRADRSASADQVFERAQSVPGSAGSAIQRSTRSRGARFASAPPQAFGYGAPPPAPRPRSAVPVSQPSLQPRRTAYPATQRHPQPPRATRLPTQAAFQPPVNPYYQEPLPPLQPLYQPQQPLYQPQQQLTQPFPQYPSGWNEDPMPPPPPSQFQQGRWVLVPPEGMEPPYRETSQQPAAVVTRRTRNSATPARTFNHGRPTPPRDPMDEFLNFDQETVG